MKKWLLLTILELLVLQAAQPQIDAQSINLINPNALGLRIGGNNLYYGAEISYQRKIRAKSRVEIDLGFRGYRYFSSAYLAFAYQWVWNITDALNWYVGPCAAFGFYRWKDNIISSSGTYLGVGGQIGLEYDFNKMRVPLLLSLDFRPLFDLVGFDEGFAWGFGLGVRYTFGKD